MATLLDSKNYIKHQLANDSSDLTEMRSVNQRTNNLLQSMDTKKSVLQELHNVAYLIQEANDLVNTLKKQRTELINNGRDVGVALTDMATILDISRQRLYQLIDEDSK